MSFQAAIEPKCTGHAGAIEMVIEPKRKDLGGFSVRRVLPSPERKMVGPFVFFDHIGSAEFPPGKGVAVRPHPHIGLATITYLFEGEIVHRDSLGFVQRIQEGAVNLMTAGKGIVHSERSGDDVEIHSRLHGIQSWMALPVEHERIEPAFEHIPADKIPTVDVDGATVTVIIGSAFGATSPVRTYASMLYLECRMPAGAALNLPDDCPERAIYVVDGRIQIDGENYEAGTMAVACRGKAVSLNADQASRVMVIGGEPVGDRTVWWNFVASSKELIEKAKADWKAGRFDKVPGETEFIPLPGK